MNSLIESIEERLLIEGGVATITREEVLELKSLIVASEVMSESFGTVTDTDSLRFIDFMSTEVLARSKCQEPVLYVAPSTLLIREPTSVVVSPAVKGIYAVPLYNRENL